MKEKTYVLAIDHGTSGVKTSIISLNGKVIDFEHEKTPIYYLAGGGAEQDPKQWWDAVIQTSQKVVGRGAVKKEEIVAVSVSSTASSTVAVDKDGNHLMNSITWMDTRGGPHVKRVMGGYPNLMGYKIPKVLKWLSRTGGAPTLSGKDDIGHVLLTKHEYPEIYDKTYMFLPSKDFLNLKLTGEFAASPDSMQLFWITDIRNIQNVQYNDELIRLFGIDQEKLPPLIGSTEILGTVLDSVAEEIGLKKGVKVVVSSPDHQCALIGSGAVRDYEAHLYIGTSSWIECIVPFKKTDIFHSIASFPSAIPGKYQIMNEQDMAGGCLPFLLDNILFYESEHLPVVPPKEAYDALNKVANKVPPGSDSLIFTPWLNGERTPVDDIMLRGGLHNISKTTTRDHLIRAVMEGVAYNTRWMFQYTEKFTKQTLTPINIIGGGAKSDIWCQIFADVLKRDIRQVKGPIHANARGAAFIAFVGLGHITFDDIPGFMQYESTFSPNSENTDIYDRLFREFLRIYKVNKRIYRNLNG